MRVLLLLTGLFLAQTLAANPVVRLGTFLVEVIEDNVVCSWSSREESLEGHYYVQKSTDGKNWETIGREVSKGVAEPNPYYRFSHQANRNYPHYRLVYRTLAGGMEVLANEQVNYYVNFSLQEAQYFKDSKQLHLEYFLDKDKRLILRLYDHIGQQVYTAHMPSGRAGIYAFDVDMQEFRNGNYLVVVTQEDFNLNVADFRLSF